jgi:hypothetical protein
MTVSYPSVSARSIQTSVLVSITLGDIISSIDGSQGERLKTRILASRGVQSRRLISFA